MDRSRAFCRFCGALTERPADPDGMYRCAGHADVPLEHEIYGLESVATAPTTAAQVGEAVQATREMRP